jgi:hypothetical protein
MQYVEAVRQYAKEGGENTGPRRNHDAPWDLVDRMTDEGVANAIRTGNPSANGPGQAKYGMEVFLRMFSKPKAQTPAVAA